MHFCSFVFDIAAGGNEEPGAVCAIIDVEEWGLRAIVPKAVPSGAGRFINYKSIHSTGPMEESSPSLRAVLMV